MPSQLRDSAKMELFGRTERRKKPLLPTAVGDDLICVWSAAERLQLSIARSVRRFRYPPRSSWTKLIEEGYICNLLATLIAIYLYVAMQPFLRFKIFFAPHQALFVSFSLSVLGYALLPLTAAAQAPSPTPALRLLQPARAREHRIAPPPN